MNNKKKFVSMTKTIKKFEKFENFDQWIREFQILTNAKFWFLTNPFFFVEFRLSAIFFFVQNLNPNVNSYLQLTAAQQKMFDTAKKYYDDDIKLYRLKQTTMTKLKHKIFESIFSHKRVDLRSIESVKSWIKQLQTTMRFTIDYLMTFAKQRYDEHMKNTRTKPTKWLNKWKIMMSNINVGNKVILMVRLT